jgi:DNA-binding transcriptional ArsR family regulator
MGKDAINTELMATLVRRADLHAALSDPARLRIVDTLTIEDAAPSELAAMLGMPSNLLAHHLRIL